jgi:hypothetical protein
MKILISLSLLGLALIILAPFAIQAEEKVQYQFKKYEKFDLGSLEVKGNVVAPGDLSVKQRERQKFERELLNRVSFREEIRQDMLNFR